MLHHAHLINLQQRRIHPAAVEVEAGRIRRIEEIPIADLPPDCGYLLPGFVDAHVHIESSMLPPAEFARMAVVHGTVATVSDPHEIANVLGISGVEFMLEDARRSPFKFCFGAPSCVPATGFETAGAALDADDVELLLKKPAIGYLSEMMNFPGVLHADPQVLAKIAAAQRLGKPVDGHAPGLRGEDARRYFAGGVGRLSSSDEIELYSPDEVRCGRETWNRLIANEGRPYFPSITTDHECFTYEEGLEKARLGVKILIREGSAARNFEALWPLLREFPQQVMFCSDDKHPDDLVQGHINQLVSRALAKGCGLFDVLRAACLHPVAHYRLPVGLLREGDPADFIRVADLQEFQVLETWLDGQMVAQNGQTLLSHQPAKTPNQFAALPRQAIDFQLPAATCRVRAIQVFDGEIVTGAAEAEALLQGGLLLPNPAHDLLKIAVINRYTASAPAALGFVRGFGLRRGALASTVAHDSHNIVAIGTDDEALAAAVNAVIAAQGGIAAADGLGESRVLPLPIAGLMGAGDGYALAEEYARLDAWVKSSLGCSFRAPFMTLSFLALPVIPKLKMTDRGMFDVEQFEFTTVQLPGTGQSSVKP